MYHCDQQVMVLKVRMSCERCRTRAFKIVAGTFGVTAVRMEGEELLVVEGHRVELADLVKTLKKKVGSTQIHYVYDV
ncbi:unnamed protein product [Cochlearia groenlandica]